MSPIGEPSLFAVPIVYVFPEPVYTNDEGDYEVIGIYFLLCSFTTLPDHRQEQWHYILGTSHQPAEPHILQT